MGAYILLSILNASRIRQISKVPIKIRIGRKIVIIVSSLIGAGIFMIIAFMEDTIIIPYLIIIASFIKSAAFPAINALVIDSTTKRKRNDAFSLLYMGYNIGFAIGPLAAGFLFVNYIELIFLIDAITTILALVPIIFFVKETLKRKAGIYLSSTDITFDEKDEKVAYSDLNRFHEHSLSFHDALLASVMRRLGVYRIFSFDSHFWTFGFEVLPGQTKMKFGKDVRSSKHPEHP